MAKKVQLMTNAKEWQTVDGVEVLVDVPQEDIDPITDSNCVEIEGHRTLEETINQENMFTPEIVETKVHSKVGGVYHDNVVDGAYEEAILYGNTQVNLVESMTSGTKYIPHSFTSFQGNESKIGNYYSGRTNQVAPLVKGVTMVNLAQTTSVELTQGQSLCVENIKGNTEYTISFVFTQKNSGAGIVIQSYNGETYLENSKLQSNLGDEVVMTFITHENANKIYINNGVGYGGETIQLDNIMVIEGDVTDLDLPFFKGMRSVELSRPLTNLFTDDLVPEVMGVTVTNSGDTVTVTSTTISTWASARYYLDLKPNTKYVIMWDGLTFTQTASGIDYIISVCENDTVFSHMGNKFTTLRSIIFDTGDKSAISIRIHAATSNSETGTTTVKGLRVFEWDDSLRTLDLQTIGYFSGTKYVSARALETEGKNLYPYGDINFTPTQVQWHDAKGTNYMYGDIAQKSKCRFLLKKGTYKLSSDYNNRTNLGYMALVTDKEETMEDTTFTLEEDTYLTLRLQPVEANVPTTLTNIQIERGETVTSYEAYQGRYYKPRETEEIILRSLPNGVCDTFNLQTGELVQNIGEVVLNGSEDEDWSQLEFSGASTVNGIADTYICYGLLLKDNARLTKNMLLYGAERHVIDTLNISSVYGDTCNQADISTEMVCIHHNGRFYLRLRKDRFSSTDLAGWKLWFSQNPVTVQYELKEPIITKLQTYDRIYNSQGLISMGNNLSALTYNSNNHYLKVGNLSPVPAILEPITTIPYDVRLKPSTLYTVKYNRGGNSSSMSFDLGGSVVEKTNATDLGIVPEEFTVKTPAILSHEQLQLSGTGFAHNFIVVEGDITGTELPYFEGMKDVKMPIVKNISRNLFDGELIVDKGINQGTGAYHDSEDWVTTKNLIPITKGKKISITIDADDEDITTNRRYVYVYKYDMNGNFMVNDRYDLGLDTKTFTMNHYGYIKCTIRTHNVKNITITETDTPQPCIDYKENSVYAVQGEIPITSEMFEQGGFSTGNGATYEAMKYDNITRLRSKDLIPVKPNTTYAFAHSFSKFEYNVYQWDGNREFIDGTSQYFAKGQVETITTTADTQYIHFLMSHETGKTITVAEYDWSQFHMYELDSTINLRSLPNGVKDELNLLTGEYIQRVGEVVLDGSDDEGWHMEDVNTANYLCFDTVYAGVMEANPLYTNFRISDKFNSISHGEYLSDSVEGIRYFSIPAISISRSKLNEPNVIGFKQYLSQNPLTIQYELAEPIISHVRLVSNNQEREVGVKLPNGVCNTYNPSTGITTVRVGIAELDGSVDEKFDSTIDVYNKENTIVFFAYQHTPLAKKYEDKSKGYPIYTNQFEYVDVDLGQTSGGMYMDVEGAYMAFDGNVCFSISKEKLKPFGFTDDMNTKIQVLPIISKYLVQNPLKAWYELKYPQIQPDIVLPNGVHDEYNPETGVYTKKVGFVEFDGNEDWFDTFTIAVNGAVNMYGMWTEEPLNNAKLAPTTDERIPGICDSLKFKNGALDMTNEEFYFISHTGRFNMNLSRSKLSEPTEQALKTYLSQNPIKLWYELQNPITYQLTPYFGLPQSYAYEDGYLIHESAYPETTLPPEFKYKLVANRTGQIVQNGRKLQEHTTRLSNLEALIIEATIESLFNRELQLFELELMDIQLIEL